MSHTPEREEIQDLIERERARMGQRARWAIEHSKLLRQRDALKAALEKIVAHEDLDAHAGTCDEVMEDIARQTLKELEEK